MQKGVSSSQHHSLFPCRSLCLELHLELYYLYGRKIIYFYLSRSRAGSAGNALRYYLKRWKKSFEMIIISLANNFIAVFQGVYLLAAPAHSLQLLLFSFWVEHVAKSLKTMSNKRCWPKAKTRYCKEHNTTPVNNYKKCCYVTENLNPLHQKVMF